MISSTRIASILNANPYESCDKYKKRFKNSFNFNFSDIRTNFGKKWEYIAIKRYEEITTNKIKKNKSTIQVHKTYDFLCGIPDGITERGTLLEVKCLYSKPILDRVPDHHMHQIQSLLHILDLKSCDYFQFKPHIHTKRGFKQDEQYSIIHVKRNELWLSTNINDLLQFHDEVFRGYGEPP